MVCVAILLSVVFNVWVVRFSLTDFNGILQDNAKCSELIQALEQESTLFESYMRNPDTEKKGIAEVIIAKQRNGPIGTIELVWLPDYTKFANLQK